MKTEITTRRKRSVNDEDNAEADTLEQIRLFVVVLFLPPPLTHLLHKHMRYYIRYNCPASDS